MKKIILTLSLSLGVISLFGQTCTPDTSIKSSGTYPTLLPTGKAGQHYEQTVQFNIAKDTTGELNGNNVNASIVSVKVLQVVGLPPGVSYKCNPSNCIMPGGQTSCAVMYGIIDSTASGTYNPEVYLQVNLLISGLLPYTQYDTMRVLSINVDDYTGIKNTQMPVLHGFPNPVINTLNLSLPFVAQSPNIQVSDIHGRILDMNYSLSDQQLFIHTEALPSGLYFGRIVDQGQAYSFRFIKQ